MLFCFGENAFFMMNLRGLIWNSLFTSFSSDCVTAGCPLYLGCRCFYVDKYDVVTYAPQAGLHHVMECRNLTTWPLFFPNNITIM